MTADTGRTDSAFLLAVEVGEFGCDNDEVRCGESPAPGEILRFNRDRRSGFGGATDFEGDSVELRGDVFDTLGVGIAELGGGPGSVEMARSTSIEYDEAWHESTSDFG